MQPDDVLRFWFEELPPAQWFTVSAALDETIRARFGALHEAATRGELFAFRETAEGRLAEVLVLDQLSRNLYRGQARAFAYDGMALVLAQEAIARGADAALPPPRRAFLYLPFMHSESLVIHQQALALFAAPGMESNLDFERRHLAILERFGRYPHRNAIVGRASTAEEIEFLKLPGSGF
jgi:uncharacterized protein (DUF924 family)